MICRLSCLIATRQVPPMSYNPDCWVVQIWVRLGYLTLVLTQGLQMYDDTPWTVLANDLYFQCTKWNGEATILVHKESSDDWIWWRRLINPRAVNFVRMWQCEQGRREHRRETAIGTGHWQDQSRWSECQSSTTPSIFHFCLLASPSQPTRVLSSNALLGQRMQMIILLMQWFHIPWVPACEAWLLSLPLAPHP